ncbi:hypothetical protein YC2023_036896 [Brassica napus]
MSMSSMSSPSSAVFSPEPLSPSDHLCYVQCNFCETILAEELRDAPSNMNMMMMNQHPNMNDIPSFMNIHRQHEITKAPPVNRPYYSINDLLMKRGDIFMDPPEI